MHDSPARNFDRYRNWRPAALGIFYPNARQYLGPGAKFSRYNTTYYRNVYDFLRRFENYLALHPGAPVQDNLDQPLQGEANTWFHCQLSLADQRYALCDPDGISLFLKRLKHRIRITPNQARRQLDNEGYRIRDVLDGRSVTEYVTSVAAIAKYSGQGPTEYSQVLLAWSNLDSELREDIDEPDDDITLDQFMDTFRAK